MSDIGSFEQGQIDHIERLLKEVAEHLNIVELVVLTELQHIEDRLRESNKISHANHGLLVAVADSLGLNGEEEAKQ